MLKKVNIKVAISIVLCSSVLLTNTIYPNELVGAKAKSRLAVENIALNSKYKGENINLFKEEAKELRVEKEIGEKEYKYGNILEKGMSIKTIKEKNKKLQSNSMHRGTNTYKNTQNKRVIVKYKNIELSDSIRKSIKKANNLKKLDIKRHSKNTSSEVLEIDKNDDINNFITELKKDPGVEYAQPDYEVTVSADPSLSDQWYLKNIGQTISGKTGTSGIDISATNAWTITNGNSDVVIGVLDTGIDLNHNSLSQSIWTNTMDIEGNNIDDDSNGYIDDKHGFDFVNNDNSIYDTSDIDSHGTSIAGIIAAQVNSGGFSGVAPNVKIMPLKFIKNNVGYTSDAIEAIEYAKIKGVKIINCSWGGIEYNPALEQEMINSGIIFICASGNTSKSMEEMPIYPAAFNIPNVIAVGAIDNKGILAPFSSYGNKVVVAAPGVDIMSCEPNNKFKLLSGTSMSAAVATGVSALVLSSDTSMNYNTIRDRIINNTSILTTLNGKVSSGGMVNALSALQNSGQSSNIVPTSEVTSTPVVNSPIPTSNNTSFYSVDGFEYIESGTIKNLDGSSDEIYRIDIPQRATYRFSTEYYTQSCDTLMELYDNNDNLISDNDDSNLTYYSTIQKVLETGTYYIRVSTYRNAVFGENNPLNCTLKVNDVSLLTPELIINKPFIGETFSLGEGINVNATGKNLHHIEMLIDNVLVNNSYTESIYFKYLLNNMESGTHTIKLKGRVTELETDPGAREVIATANFTVDNTLRSGSVKAVKGSNTVEYPLTIESSGTYKLSTEKLDQDCDTIIELKNIFKSTITQNDDYNSIYSSLQKGLQAGSYYIKVTAKNGANLDCLLKITNVADLQSDINITTPLNNTIYSLNESININVIGESLFDIKLYINNIPVNTYNTDGQGLTYSFVPTQAGIYTIKAEGRKTEKPDDPGAVTEAIERTVYVSETYSFDQSNVGEIKIINDKQLAVYKFDIEQTGNFKMYTEINSKDCDTYIELYNNKKEIIAVNDNYHNSNYSRIQAELTAGIYYALVTTINNKKSINNSNSYTLVSNTNCKFNITSVEVLAPENLSVKPFSTNTSLTWNKVNNATSYEIYRNGTVDPIVTINNPNITSYSDAGLSPDTIYEYTIYAKNNSGLRSEQTGPVVVSTSSSTLTINAIYDSASHSIIAMGTLNEDSNKVVNIEIKTGQGFNQSVYSGQVTTTINGTYSLKHLLKLDASSGDYKVVATSDSTAGSSEKIINVNSIPEENESRIVSGGHDFTVYLVDGQAKSFGYNIYGQLGNGTNIDSASPVNVLGLTGITAVSAGYYHALFLKEDGTVWSVGRNNAGQLGDGTYLDRSTPVHVRGIKDAIAISGGRSHSMALTSDGKVYTWGSGYNGQMGDGFAYYKTLATSIPIDKFPQGTSKIKAIKAGYESSFALDESGNLYSWGINNAGQLGNGTTISIPANQNFPAKVSAINNVKKISINHDHILVVKQDGTVWGWGVNRYGELGNPTKDGNYNSLVPIQSSIPSGETIYNVAAGSGHSLYLTNKGDVYGSGSNACGQLGYTRDYGPQLTKTNINSVHSITSGYSYGAAKRSDSTLWTWGDNTYGQLGISPALKVSSNIPAQTAEISLVQAPLNLNAQQSQNNIILSWSSVSNAQKYIIYRDNVQIATNITSASYTDYLSNTGLAYAYKVYAKNANGEISDPAGPIIIKSTQDNNISPTPTTNVAVANDIYNTFDTNTLSSGEEFVIYIDKSGIVKGLGKNTNGQLGAEPTGTPKTNIPITIDAGGNVKAVKAGYNHTLILKKDGTVWALGSNTYGQLGNGTKSDTYIPIQVKGIGGVGTLNNIIAVSAGRNHSLALDKDGKVYAWGQNYFGQLGDSTNAEKILPVQVQLQLQNDRITSIDTGEYTSMAVDNNGFTYGWGMNNHGQIEIGLAIYVYTPTKLIDSNKTNIKKASLGRYSTMALKKNGTAWGWGNNQYGDLGTNTNGVTTNNPPVKADIPDGISLVGIASEEYTRLLLASNGDVYSCGNNMHGELGVNDYVNRYTLVKVPIDNAYAVSGRGWSMGYILKKDGTLWGCGSNSSDQLGVDSTSLVKTPVPILVCNDVAVFLPPQTITAQTTINAVNLKWTTSIGAESYEIYRNGEYIATVKDAVAYKDNGLSPATTYTYTIYAKNADGVLSTSSYPYITKTCEVANISTNVYFENATRRFLVNGDLSSGAGKQVAIQVKDESSNVVYTGNTVTTNESTYSLNGYLDKDASSGKYCIIVTDEVQNSTTGEFDYIKPQNINVSAIYNEETQKVALAGVLESRSNMRVMIRILDPNNTPICVDQVFSKDNGIYSYSYPISNSMQGTYRAVVSAQDIALPASCTFEVGQGSAITNYDQANVSTLIMPNVNVDFNVGSTQNAKVLVGDQTLSTTISVSNTDMHFAQQLVIVLALFDNTGKMIESKVSYEQLNVGESKDVNIALNNSLPSNVFGYRAKLLVAEGADLINSSLSPFYMNAISDKADYQSGIIMGKISTTNDNTHYPDASIKAVLKKSVNGDVVERTSTFNNGENMSYQFPNIPVGNYILELSKPGYLTRLIAVSSVAGQITEVPDKELIGGDINCDGVINQYDQSELNSIIANKNYKLNADICTDGVINNMDQLILTANIGKSIKDYNENVVVKWVNSKVYAYYEYDNLGRLLIITYTSGQKITYSYDAGGNILSITKTTQ